MNREIMFLPTSAIPEFMAASSVLEKAKVAVKSIGESHHTDYNIENLDYDIDQSDLWEPYASIRGYNVPILADMRMLCEYLNTLEPNGFYIDEDDLWGCVCLCYVPPCQRLDN
jgi:hypothetical protein